MNSQALLHALETVLPLFFVLALGMLCRRKKLFSSEGVAALKSLVVNITLPAVMFSAFATAQYTASSVTIPLLIFSICALALALGFAARRLFCLQGKLTPYLATGFEAGMLGYALFALLFPQESASCFAIVDLGQVLFVFTVYKAMLAGRSNLKGTLIEAVRSPVIWAIALGLLFGATGLYRRLATWGISGVLDHLAGFIAAPTSAVILLTIGYDLVPGEIRWKRTAALAGMRLLIMGLLFGVMLLLNRTLLDGVIHEGALALMFILPPPFVLPVFARLGEERANVVGTLSALTLVSVLLFAGLTIVFA